jgi:nucleoside-triphosphatase
VPIRGDTVVRLLVEGRPGIGKTTVARRLVNLLRAAGVPLAGFTTEEIREGKGRVGFALETVSGERGILAHVDLPGPPRVGKYGVDLAGFERVALPALRKPGEKGVVIVDELGKMELASGPFRQAVLQLLDEDVALVATVHIFRHPFTDATKARPDVEVTRLTVRNRETLPVQLAARLSSR